MSAPARSRPRRTAALLRSPWALPGAWLLAMATAAALVFMPPARGLPGKVVGAVSLVLAVVLVASVAVVAAALVGPVARRVLTRLAEAAQARAAQSRERRP